MSWDGGRGGLRPDGRPATSSSFGPGHEQDPSRGYGQAAETSWGNENRGRDGGDVPWTPAEESRLRESVRENGLDSWTLGDWSEVAAAVGGSKTPEQCFNRWHAEKRAQGYGYHHEGSASASQSPRPRAQESRHGGGFPPETRRFSAPPPGTAAQEQHPAFRLPPPHLPSYDGRPRGSGNASAGYNAPTAYPAPYLGQPYRPVLEPDVQLPLSQSHGPYPWQPGGGGPRGGIRGQGPRARGGERALRDLADMAARVGEGNRVADSDSEEDTR